MFPYRVLDLADERGILCGKVFADLGADVIKIELPEGDPARKIGPFYKDIPGPENSLFWWAYSSNKRSITLNITDVEGRQVLKKLVESADFLIESFDPGYLDSLGLDYKELSKINPRLIMISITPFGQEGPYAHYKVYDLVGSSMGGLVYITGEPKNPPMAIGFPQFYFHGAVAGATGGLIAHYWRNKSGNGQYVDVSCQEAMVRTLSQVPQCYEADGLVIEREGNTRRTGKDLFMRMTWPCKDGYVNFMLSGGPGAGGSSMRELIRFMEEEGYDASSLQQVDWGNMPYGGVSEEVLNKISGVIESFFLNHSKRELTEQAISRRMLLFPINSVSEIFHYPQLNSRCFFEPVASPLTGENFICPGSVLRFNNQPSIRRFAPLIGEHNAEIYEKELGFSQRKIALYKIKKII